MCWKNLLLLCITLVLITSGHVRADLIAHWALDEGAGTIATDSSANGYNCTFHGSPQWVDGVFGSALELNGSTDYLTVDAGAEVVTPVSFTVTMWVYFNSTSGRRDFFFKDDSPTFTLNEWANDGRIHPVIRTGAANWGQFPGDTTVETDRWYYVAMTYDNDSHLFTLYLDGINDGEQTYPSGVYYPASGTWYIGGRPSYVLNGRIDDVRMYDNVLSVTEIQAIMKGAPPVKAAKPNPMDEEEDVSRDALLNWTPGAYAQTHDIFLGTDFDDVNNATIADPLSTTAIEGHDVNNYDPGRLDFAATYYWRIDEVNDPAKPGTYKGDIWSFTVEPYAYKLPAERITVTASSTASGYDPNDTINEAGLDPNTDQHSSSNGMWLSDMSEPNKTWIRYDFDKLYKINNMLVWNFNKNLINYYGFNEVRIEYSEDGQTWTVIPDVNEFPEGPGKSTYGDPNVVPFNGAVASSVRITALSNWKTTSPRYGLSEVRFTYIPVRARKPSPTPDLTDASVATELGWRAGRDADKHYLYLSTDMDSVAQNLVDPVILDETSYVPDFTLGQTYYWKIDEVNNAEAHPVWDGPIWNFSIAKYMVVDNFEVGYDNSDANAVWATWVDGYGVNENGSQMGYDYPGPYLSTTYHGGGHSAPLIYNNTGTATYSEVKADTSNLVISSDWSEGHPDTLEIWFMGEPNNVTTNQLYVKLNDTKKVYDGDAANLAKAVWTRWEVPLTGINLSNITSVAIGVEKTGATGGSGTLLLDDIRLGRFVPAVDPGTDNLIAKYDMENNVVDSVGGLNGTANNGPTYAAGKTGLALVLDGNDQYVELPIGDVISTLESCTISTWVNWTTSDSSWWERVFDFGSGTANNLWFTPRSGDNSMRAELNTSNGSADQANASPRMAENNWEHIAVVIDASNMTLSLYLNGYLAASDTTLKYLPKDMGVTTQNWLGRSQYTADEYFEGMLDDFRIYDRALSAGEVKYISQN